MSLGALLGEACQWCGQYHTTAACFVPTPNPTVACAPVAFNPSIVIGDGVARCGLGCPSLPCQHFPGWFVPPAPRISAADVDRIAHRVVKLLEAKKT